MIRLLTADDDSPDDAESLDAWLIEFKSWPTSTLNFSYSFSARLLFTTTSNVSIRFSFVVVEVVAVVVAVVVFAVVVDNDAFLLALFDEFLVVLMFS